MADIGYPQIEPRFPPEEFDRPFNDGHCVSVSCGLGELQCE